MKYIEEDFKDFPIGEFPYDHEHSALGEYHYIDYPGYKGNFYDPITNHQWRSKDGSWLVVGDGENHFLEQNHGDMFHKYLDYYYPNNKIDRKLMKKTLIEANHDLI